MKPISEAVLGSLAPKFRIPLHSRYSGRESQQGAGAVAGKQLPFSAMITKVAVAVFLIVVSGLGWVYFSNGFDTIRPLKAYTEIVVPKGKSNMLVCLPDSSTVWLYPGSILRFPKQFASVSREVELVNGVAFFTVKRDEKRSFTVKTNGGVQTNVMGSTFVIKAYQSLPYVEVSLLSGAISVRDSARQLGVLGPNQQMMYSKLTHKEELRGLNAEECSGWLKGRVVLEDANFKEIAMILEDIYKVHISYNKEQLAFCKFDIHFSNAQPVEEVLNLIKGVSNLNYVINGNQVSIKDTNAISLEK